MIIEKSTILKYPFHIFLFSPTFTLSSSPGGPSGGGAHGVRRTRGSSLRFLRLIRSSDVVDLGSWVSTSVLDPARFIQPTFCLTMIDGYSFPVIKPNMKMTTSQRCIMNLSGQNRCLR
ncbi:BnaA09g20080D [Brassica napus]|uniref:(rape) hypothetical protein n=1 Tax=Brassica napus TaxID=3708 RepID=A0A078FQ96_BRANA|nr:unnamed protein product [Brassica napus]CDY16630.1 BnaA09g20080D [Brassica napus]